MSTRLVRGVSCVDPQGAHTRRSGISPEGKRVVVCGRSNIVGKPLAILLMQKAEGANATVTLCHTGTRNLMEIMVQADILVAAMGRPGGITADTVKEGAVVINRGRTLPRSAGAGGGRGL